MKKFLFLMMICLWLKVVANSNTNTTKAQLSPNQQKQLMNKTQSYSMKVAMASIDIGDIQNAFVVLQQNSVHLEQMRLALHLGLVQSSAATKRELPKSNLDTNKTLKIIKNLSSDYAIVMPFITSSKSVLFVIRGGETTIGFKNIISLDINSSQLSEITNNFFAKCYNANSVDVAPTLRALNKIAQQIDDALTELGGIQRVLYMPDRRLASLPLTACGKQKKLFEKYVFQTLTNLNALEAKSHDNLTEHSILAVINPTLDLQYSRVEGDMVQKMFGKSRSLLENNATKKAFLAEIQNRHNYLYFSGHGNYDSQNPLKSALIFNDANLTILDLYVQKHLERYDLAFLSACQTNMLYMQMPLEIANITGALLESGVNSVISTLFEVNEKATMFLVIKFFQLHIKEGIDAPKALQMAKSWLRNADANKLLKVVKKYQDNYSFGASFSDLDTLMWELYEQVAKHNNPKPFSNAKYWAGFVYNGIKI